MAIIEQIYLSGIGATRDIDVPAGHRLSIQNGPFEMPLFRLCDKSVVKRNLIVEAGETFTITSPRATRWRVGPVSTYATATIETTD